MKNWYILFVQIDKQSQLCSLLEQEGVRAFLPMTEYYRRDRKGLAEKPLFPAYIFVQSDLNLKEFDSLLDSLEGRRWGFIRQAVLSVTGKYVVKSVAARENRLVVELQKDILVPNDVKEEWVQTYEKETGEDISFF